MKVKFTLRDEKTIYLDFVGYSRFVCEKKEMKKEDEKKLDHNYQIYGSRS